MDLWNIARIMCKNLKNEFVLAHEGYSKNSVKKMLSCECETFFLSYYLAASDKFELCGDVGTNKTCVYYRRDVSD